MGGHSEVSSAAPLAAMMAEVQEVNKANGWYDKPVAFLEAMYLMFEEVFEAGTAYREHGMDDMTEPGWMAEIGSSGIPKPEGVGSEFADILIRLLDYCGRYGVDLDFEYRRKLDFNRTRGYRHGGKRA